MSLIIIADNIPQVAMACTLLVLSIVFSDQPHHINYFVQLYLLHKQRGDSHKNVLLTTVFVNTCFNIQKNPTCIFGK